MLGFWKKTRRGEPQPKAAAQDGAKPAKPGGAKAAAQSGVQAAAPDGAKGAAQGRAAKPRPNGAAKPAAEDLGQTGGARPSDAAAAPFEFDVSVVSDTGCVREKNEDSGRFFIPQDPSKLSERGLLALVADGMGGHASGEVASGMAVESIIRRYYNGGGGDPSDALREAFEGANAEIYEASLRDPELSGMGTTCTALVLHDGQAVAAHVGDSRLYMLRDGELYQLTEDHSAVMEMVKQGLLTMDEARRHVDKNVILRALGTSPEVEVAVWDRPTRVHAGDQYLLCSDVLHDLVEDEEIRQALTEEPGAHEASARLVAWARERGGHDNITVGVIRVRRAGGDADESQEVRATRDLRQEVRATRDLGTAARRGPETK